MLNPTEQPWAAFADDMAREFLEHGADQAVLVTRNEKEDRVTTHYFNCDFEKRCLMIGHILEDLILEVIDINADTVREILEEDEE